jgi:hypothetical protein
MMDDVVGLVMVQIVSGLGASSVDEGGEVDISPVTVIRPVLVSVAFATLIPLGCRFILRPMKAKLGVLRARCSANRSLDLLGTQQSVFTVQTGMLIGLVVGASYAGASVLLAAYLAGVIGAWWDEESSKSTDIAATISSSAAESTRVEEMHATTSSSVGSPALAETHEPETVQLQTPSSDMYKTHYAQAVERVLKPFFFVGNPYQTDSF